jgi:uncharacterized membrane protein
MRRFVIALILVSAFFGLADSAYLARSATNEETPLCDFRVFEGCETVAKSPFSKVLGVPLAQFGIVFFTLLFILAALELVYSHQYVRRAIQGSAAVGLIVSAYFIFIQVSVIQAFCIYCVFSAAVTACIFGLAYLIEPLSREPWPKGVARQPSFASVLQKP